MLQILVSITIFLTGLAVGSFLNCVIYRLAPHQSFQRKWQYNFSETKSASPSTPKFGVGASPLERSNTPTVAGIGGGLKGRSFCPNCRHILNWQDVIPIFSFLILKGKCRYCQKPISWQYPIVEISTGLIFLLIFNFLPPFCERAGFNQFSILNFLNTCFLFLVSCFLIIIFIYDLKYYIIPDKVIYPAIAIAFLYRLFGTFETLLNPFLSAFLASTFFLIIILISQGKWMGVGDIKLAFLMGLFLGWPNILVALFLSFLIGAIIGIGLIITGRKTLKSEVPFGPFLVTGTFIAFFWGETIIRWYLQFVIF